MKIQKLNEEKQKYYIIKVKNFNDYNYGYVGEKYDGYFTDEGYDLVHNNKDYNFGIDGDEFFTTIFGTKPHLFEHENWAKGYQSWILDNVSDFMAQDDILDFKNRLSIEQVEVEKTKKMQFDDGMYRIFNFKSEKFLKSVNIRSKQQKDFFYVDNTISAGKTINEINNLANVIFSQDEDFFDNNYLFIARTDDVNKALVFYNEQDAVEFIDDLIIVYEAGPWKSTAGFNNFFEHPYDLVAVGNGIPMNAKSHSKFDINKFKKKA